MRRVRRLLEELGRISEAGPGGEEPRVLARELAKSPGDVELRGKVARHSQRYGIEHPLADTDWRQMQRKHLYDAFSKANSYEALEKFRSRFGVSLRHEKTIWFHQSGSKIPFGDRSGATQQQAADDFRDAEKVVDDHARQKHWLLIGKKTFPSGANRHENIEFRTEFRLYDTPQSYAIFRFMHERYKLASGGYSEWLPYMIDVAEAKWTREKGAPKRKKS